MTHNELIQRGAKWLKSNHYSKYRFPVILTDYHCFSDERPDIIGFAKSSSIVIECKVSLSDFKADLKKPHRQYVNKGSAKSWLVASLYHHIKLYDPRDKIHPVCGGYLYLILLPTVYSGWWGWLCK